MKLRNKLILSCAALAAVATTAVSTTFAWYTSNQEVTADEIKASTSSNSDALLLISKTGAKNSWSSNVSLNIDADLVPVYRDAAGAIHAWAPDTNTPAEAAAPTSAYIQFSLYFKSGNNNALTVSYKNFDILNTTEGNFTTKSVLTNVGLPAAATQSGEYTVNLLKALTMENTFGNAYEGQAGSSAQDFTTTADNLLKPAYEFETYATKADTVGNKDVNAHDYYNDVKQLNYKRATAFAANTTYYVKTDDVYTAVATDASFNANTKYYEKTGTTYVEATVTADNFATKKAGLFTLTAGTYTQATTQPTADNFANGVYYYVASIENRYDGSVAYRTTNATDPRVEATIANLNSTAEGNQSINKLTIGGDAANSSNVTILRADYVIYLDGWDFHCFDACQSQKVSIAMTFQSNSVQQG